MKNVHVCLFWHMHQPYYTDPVAGSASMPWVRLHATKAYYDMAYLLEKFPADASRLPPLVPKADTSATVKEVLSCAAGIQRTIT